MREGFGGRWYYAEHAEPNRTVFVANRTGHMVGQKMGKLSNQTHSRAVLRQSQIAVKRETRPLKGYANREPNRTIGFLQLA